jgi:hypothetical protein
MIFNRQGANEYNGVRREIRLQNQSMAESRETQLAVTGVRGFPGTKFPNLRDQDAGGSSDKNVHKPAQEVQCCYECSWAGGLRRQSHSHQVRDRAQKNL